MNKQTPIKLPKSLKLVKVGNSTGVILPKDILARMGLELGDTLKVKASDDGIELRPSNSDFEEQMAAARKVMGKRKRALRELAK